MKRKIEGIVLFILICQLAAGYALANDTIEANLVKVSPGMSKEQVVGILGKPDAILSSSINEQGKPTEVLQYDVVKDLPVTSLEGAGQSLGGFTAGVLTLGMSETMKARNRPFEEAVERQNLDLRRLNNPPYLLVFEDNVLKKIEKAVMVPRNPSVQVR